MRENGSPPPVFEFDEDHSYFMVRLPVHPEAALPATTEVRAHDEAHDEAARSLTATERGILVACGSEPQSVTQLLAVLGQATRSGGFKRALAHLLAARYVEMTLPDRPRSRSQRYRLTTEGRTWLSSHAAPGEGAA